MILGHDIPKLLKMVQAALCGSELWGKACTCRISIGVMRLDVVSYQVAGA